MFRPIRLFGFIAVVGLLLAGCSNNQPTPQDAVTVNAIPVEMTKVIGHWKMGDYTIGCRIVTDEYVFVTDGGGLFGQEGQAFGGPGLVDHATVASFERIMPTAETAKANGETLTFYGDQAHNKDGSVYTWKGKKVVLLHTATYKGTTYEVNRRPWDN